MLEIFLYNESTDSYDIFVDLFKDTEIELNIPLFPSTELSERLIDYTDSFDLPATHRNLSEFDKENTERFKCQMKSGGQTLTGFLSVNSITYNTPEASISVNFVSIIKYVIDKMKETPFANLFKDYNETGANPYDDGNGNYINDGEYGFNLDETVNDEFGSFMKLAVNNMASEQYSKTEFPVYIMDSVEGSRSALPAFNMKDLLKSMFSHYSIDIDLDGFVTGSLYYSDVSIKIPVNFLSDPSDRSYRFDVYDDGKGLISNVVHYQQKPVVFGKPYDYSYPLTINGQLQTALVMQSKTLYEIECTRNMLNTELEINVDTWFTYRESGGSESEPVYLELTIPESKINIISGDIFPCVIVRNYNEAIGHIKYNENGNGCFYGGSSSFSPAETFSYESKYSDAITFELGYYASALSVKIPDEYDLTTSSFSETKMSCDIISGYYTQKQLLNIITEEKIYLNGTYNGNPIVSRGNVQQYIEFNELEFFSGYSEFTMTPLNDLEESRFGDYVKMVDCYSSLDTTFYDVLDIIMRRFYLSVKEIDGEIELLNENNFYKNETIVLDNKLSGKILKGIKENKYKSINFLNSSYGNVNDLINKDSNEGYSIFDIYDLELDSSEFDEYEYKYNSTIQNDFVYGERITADDIDNWEYMGLKDDFALWNSNLNEKIKTKDLPISFGILSLSNISSFRFPRANYVNSDNYPYATSEALSSNEGILIVEHSEFECDNSFYRLVKSDHINLSDEDGGIDSNNMIYDNFKDFIDRNRDDAVNIECEAYLTNEEIIQLRNGYKIQLFGEKYKPINISNIQFEKDGSIVEIEMTKERGVTDATFDSDTITFDSDIYTWDAD